MTPDLDALEAVAKAKAVAGDSFGPATVLALIAEARKARAAEALAGEVNRFCLWQISAFELAKALASYTAAIAPTQPED